MGQTGIVLTPTARERLQAIQQEHGLQGYALRFYIAGGCSCSPQIAMAFDDHILETDHVFEVEGLRVIVDSDALALLEGAQVDYVRTPEGEGFVLSLATTPAHEHNGGCGCGH